MPEPQQEKERIFGCLIDRQTKLEIKIIKFNRGYVIERTEITEGKYPEDHHQVTHVMLCRSDEQLNDTMSNEPHFTLLRDKFAKAMEELSQ